MKDSTVTKKSRGIIFTVREGRRLPITEAYVQKLRDMGVSKEAVDFARKRLAREAH